MTLAPRVQVYTQLACQSVYHHSPLSLSVPATTPLFISPLSPLPTSHVAVSVPVVPPHQDPCKSDPAVQARAASFQMLYMLIMDISSALSASSWGHFGERRGRLRVLALSSIGLVFTLVMCLCLQPTQAHSPTVTLHSQHWHPPGTISPPRPHRCYSCSLPYSKVSWVAGRPFKVQRLPISPTALLQVAPAHKSLPASPASSMLVLRSGLLSARG